MGSLSRSPITINSNPVSEVSRGWQKRSDRRLVSHTIFYQVRDTPPMRCQHQKNKISAVTDSEADANVLSWPRERLQTPLAVIRFRGLGRYVLPLPSLSKPPQARNQPSPAGLRWGLEPSRVPMARRVLLALQRQFLNQVDGDTPSQPRSIAQRLPRRPCIEESGPASVQSPQNPPT